MGARLIQAVVETDALELAGAFERPEHDAVGRDAGAAAGLGELGIKVAASLDEVLGAGEVVIDFTQPQATLAHLEKAAKAGKAMVVGTTGFSPEEMTRIRELAQKTRLALAPNMSIGVNLMFKIAAEMAKVLNKGFDLEIVEAHHRMKKDAPSGTAMRLAEIVAEATGRDLSKNGVYGREGIVGKRTDDEIAVLAVRAGDIVGEHTVIFGGIGERIELTHRAHSRDNFARGAVRAAAWIVNQPPGFYDMQDVLELR